MNASGTPERDRARRLARARDYPYEIPRHSFTYGARGVEPFDETLARGRTPVLAIGSNQSPRRLGQKFRHAAHAIPVERATLDDFDVVFSAHVSSYGAIPAMLQVARGACVSLAVTWLDDEQLDIMHASEVSAANYRFARLDGVRLRLERGATAHTAFAYVSSRGHLPGASDRSPIALAAIACAGRRYDEMHAAEALELVRRRVAPDAEAEAFVHRLVDDPDYRHRVTARLAADAVALEWPARILE